MICNVIIKYRYSLFISVSTQLKRLLSVKSDGGETLLETACYASLEPTTTDKFIAFIIMCWGSSLPTQPPVTVETDSTTVVHTITQVTTWQKTKAICSNCINTIKRIKICRLQHRICWLAGSGSSAKGAGAAGAHLHPITLAVRHISSQTVVALSYWDIVRALHSGCQAARR